MTAVDTPLRIDSENPDARTRLLALINASWTTQALSVATQLRLAELLSNGPLTAEELAKSACCHTSSLQRLLHALTSLGVTSQQEDGRIALTELGALLRPDVPGSLGAWAEFCGTSSWETWSQLAECVRSGESVRKRTRGADGFDHLQEDRKAALLFNRAMVSVTASVAAAVVQAVDFVGVKTVVDVGGGYGSLVAAVLSAYPAMRGVLYDLAHATESAVHQLAEAGVANRCEVVTGSFFDNVPGGADAYLLKSILHDWDDEHCAAILRNCRRAMEPRARLLVIERMMPEHMAVSMHDQRIARSDLNMLVGTGGCERTQEQFRTMLHAAGLRSTRLVALSDGYSSCEAVPE